MNKLNSMTPKEKATELYESFAVYTCKGNEYDDLGEYKKANKYFCKNACLLCVDEIIKANPRNPPRPDSDWRNQTPREYWQQVKEELQKL